MTLQSLRQYINSLPPHIRSRQQAALLMECEARLAEATGILGTMLSIGIPSSSEQDAYLKAREQAQRFIEQLNRKD